MRTIVALAAMLLALPARAGDAPDSAAVHALVAQLGSGNPAARDRAFAALVAMGDAVANLIRKELEGEAGKDPEVAVRGRECLEKIATNLKLKQLWERDPQKELDEWIARDTCGVCGNLTAWKAWPIRHVLVRDSLPRARIFVMDWICCQDHMIESVLLAVCRDPDEVFEIHGAEDLNRLTGWIAPIRSRVDFESAVSSMIGLLAEPPWDGPLEYEPHPVSATTEGGRFVTHEPKSLIYAVWDPETRKLTFEKKPVR